MYIRKLFFLLISIILSNCSTERSYNEEDYKPPELKPVGFKYSEVDGIGHEQGCTRRDPSDVIKVNDTYYIWYTKIYGRASGYWGTIWYATSEDEGYSWAEQEEALGLGEEGTFDSHATFTPNIISAKGKYYLFYTGVKPTPDRTNGVFENNSTTDITAIGVAVADSPDGPFRRISSEPVLKVSVEPEKFDSYRVDDAALLKRNGKYWLYYKGRSRVHGVHGPGKTRMGIAFADKPEGPYTKYSSPILSGSHEVLIWPHRTGVAALASISSTLEYALDGIDFDTNKPNAKITKRPNASGAYRPDLTKSVKYGNGLKWGISMIHNGPESYLIRFECDLEVKE